MEVTLAAHSGLTPPGDTFVSLRIGQVQRHARFANTRVYRFPEEKLDPKACGRIEVFKRLGATTVCLGSSCGDVQDIEVPCNDPNFTKLRMRVTTTDCLAAGDQTPGKVQKKSAMRVNSARRYLADHQLEDVLKEAMKEVMSQKPNDPHDFIAQFILRHPTRRLNLPPLSPAMMKPEEAKFPPIAANDWKPTPYPDALEFKDASPAKSLPPPATPTQRPRNLPPIEKTPTAAMMYSKSTPALSQPPPPLVQKAAPVQMHRSAPTEKSAPPQQEIKIEKAPVEAPASPQVFSISGADFRILPDSAWASMHAAYNRKQEPMPTTELTEPVPAGSKVLPVAASGGFAVGDPIYIKSTAGSEANAIKGFGSIALMYPLRFSHPPGTSISKLQAEDPLVKTLPPDFLAQVKRAAAAPEVFSISGADFRILPDSAMESIYAKFGRKPLRKTFSISGGDFRILPDSAMKSIHAAYGRKPVKKAGFGEYYCKNFGGSQIMETMAHKMFGRPSPQAAQVAQVIERVAQEEAAAKPAATETWMQRPSVGTWCAPRLARSVAAAAAPVTEASPKWQLRPSVGTWLAARPALPSCATQPPAPVFQHWQMLPSVGTWCAHAPYRSMREKEGTQPEYSNFLHIPSVGSWCALIVGSAGPGATVSNRQPNLVRRQSTVKFRTPDTAETMAMTTLLRGRMEEIQDLERQHAAAEIELKQANTEEAREMVELVGCCLDAARAEYEALQQWGIKRGLSTPQP